MAKNGQALVNAQDGVNNLPAVDFNNSTREMADAIFEGLSFYPAPSGVPNFGSTNEVKQAMDINVLSRANCFVCTGGGNAYILTTDVAFQLRKLSYYYKYSRVNFTATFTNTGACTVKVDDGATVALEKTSGALTGGEIVAGSDYILEYNGSKWIVKNPSGGVYFKQQIIISNNITDPSNDINFSAGNFVFQDKTSFANLSAITKRLDANFAIGTNQGGLDTGTKQINTQYHCYAIYNPTTQVSDAIFSTNTSVPTLPSGFTKYEYVNTIMTDASGNIIPFTQNGKVTELVSSIETHTNVAQANNTEVLRTLSTAGVPLGRRIKAFGMANATIAGSNSAASIKLYSANQTKTTLGIREGNMNSSSLNTGTEYGNCRWEAITNATSQIKTNARVIAGAPTASLYITVDGWEFID